MRAGERGAARQRGYTFLGVMFLVALTGLALAGTGELWSQAVLRERERELLWVGTQYAEALRSYYRHSAGRPAYPRDLAELLEDRRGPRLQRHLRKHYADPLSGQADWLEIRIADGSIVGVRSRAHGTPLKRAGFAPRWRSFERAQSYADWRFVAEPEFAALTAAGSAR